MGKKRKPRKANKPYVPKLSPGRYNRLYLILEQGENEAHTHGRTVIYFEVSGGERPGRLLADFRHVAKKAGIPVVIDMFDDSQLVLKYQTTPPDELEVEIYDGDTLVDKSTIQ